MAPESVHDLVGQHRLVEARRLLRVQQKRNERVYGLEDSLKRIEHAVNVADEVANRIDALVPEGHIREALAQLLHVKNSVSDHDVVNLWVSKLTKRIEEGRRLRKVTNGLMEDAKWTEAWQTAEQSLLQDPESKTGRQQLEEIQETCRGHVEEAKTRRLLFVMTVSGAVFVVIGIVIAVIINLAGQSQRAADQEALQQATANYTSALAQIESEQYTEANSLLAKSLANLRNRGLDNDPLYDSITQTQASEDIKQGLAGRVPLGGEWMTPQHRDEELAERETLSSDIDAAAELVQKCIQGELPRGSRGVTTDRTSVFEGLMGNIQAARYDFDAGEYELSRDSIKQVSSEIISNLEQLGLAYFDDQWMNPEQVRRAKEKLRLAAEQAERERQAAAERAERERQAAADQAERERKAAAERARLLRQAEAQADHKAKMQRLSQSAYLMSQKFVRDILKAPSTARFPSYSDDAVVVIEADTKGHFIVKGYVDAQNGFGAMIRSVYYVELWPTDDEGSMWRAKTPVLDD